MMKDKAPMLDGFPLLFFRRHWYIIRYEVVVAM